MDCMKIGKLDEADFDSIIRRAGGRRFSDDDSRETKENVDYVLFEAIVELKLIDEEGLEKEERRRKIADIFRTQQPDRPVIVLRPDLLNLTAQRAYYSALAGPIKSHIEKANKQLKQSTLDAGNDPVRVLLLINNGYAALSHDEFKEITIKRACNDTHHIDAVVVGGLYFYSDGFDMYFFPRMDLFPIHMDRPFESYDLLLQQWNSFEQDFLTKFVLGEDARSGKRLPVQDFRYEFDDIIFVKPAPPMGKPSDFYVNGRPRKNSTGITSCPPVAKTFPNFDSATWRRFRDYRSWDQLSWDDFFKATYGEWGRFRQEQEKELATPVEPFVPVTVDFDAWLNWCKEQGRQAGVSTLCQYASVMFQNKILPIIETARSRDNATIVMPRYVLLVTEEIGQDRANDLCSIYLVDERIDGENRRTLIENERIFFEHGLALASAYALKTGVDSVMYEKDLTNAWI